MQDQIAAGTMKEETLPLLMSSLEGDVQAKPYTFLHKTIGYTGWHMVGVSKGDTGIKAQRYGKYLAGSFPQTGWTGQP